MVSKRVGISIGLTVALLVGGAVSYSSIMDRNVSGERVYVETFTGDTKVVYEPGPYYYGNGVTTPYKNALRTIKTPNGRACDYEQNDGFIVQYGDGGKGSICAQLDAQLPMDETTFKALHKRFRTEQGVRDKLLDPNFRSLFTTTAELFTSTEAYETKRSQIAFALQDQLKNGAYVTTVEDREIVVGIDENGKEITQTKGFSIIKRYPEGHEKAGAPMYQPNVFSDWNMTDIKVTVTGFDFEPKTMQQISDRRDAANRAQTAQANAKAAYWEGEQAKADGETRRIKAQAAAEVKNAPIIADAQREAELALIEATKQKEKATEMRLAAVEATKQKEQEALQALEEAKIIKTLADAESYKVDKMQQAGELYKRIDADVQKNKDIADALARMNVPQTMIVGGGNATDGSTEMQQLLQLQVLDKLGTPATKKPVSK